MSHKKVIIFLKQRQEEKEVCRGWQRARKPNREHRKEVLLKNEEEDGIWERKIETKLTKRD
jgi:hypothetical protein